MLKSADYIIRINKLHKDLYLVSSFLKKTDAACIVNYFHCTYVEQLLVRN